MLFSIKRYLGPKLSSFSIAGLAEPPGTPGMNPQCFLGFYVLSHATSFLSVWYKSQVSLETFRRLWQIASNLWDGMWFQSLTFIANSFSSFLKPCFSTSKIENLFKNNFGKWPFCKMEFPQIFYLLQWTILYVNKS